MIADDHPYIVEGIKQFILGSDVEVVGHAFNLDEIISVYQQVKPDVLLCDIEFRQQMHGLDVVKRLVEIDPTAKVIMFSQHEQIEIIVSAYDSGAKAFLDKSVPSSTLISVIRKVNSGEVYFDEKVAVQMALYNHKAKSKKVTIEDILDAKEIPVFRLLGEGLTEKEIADELGIATRTVSNIKIALKEKLKVHKPAEFTKLAIKYNLISIDVN